MPLRYGKLMIRVRQLINLTEREQMLEWAFAFTKPMKEQNYMEFGVYKGNLLALAYHLAESRGQKMGFYAFDSFEGLPKLKDIDMTGEFKDGQYSCSLEDFNKNLKSQGVDLIKINTIKGWFDNSLKDKRIKKSLKDVKASVIYIDSDIYESAKLCFEWITEHIQDGTVIIFDDWFCFNGRADKGEQRAFNEWLTVNPRFIATEFHKFEHKGNSFIISLRARDEIKINKAMK